MTDSLPARRALGSMMLVALSSGAGCSKVVDVGQNDATGAVFATSTPPTWKSSSAGPSPVFKVVDNEMNISAVAADAGRVFWIAARVDSGIPSNEYPPPMMSIQSCDTRNCKGSLRIMNVFGDDGSTVYSGAVLQNPSLVLNETDVFWSDPMPGGDAAYCSRGISTSMNRLDFSAARTFQPTFGVDDTYFYFTAGQQLPSTTNVLQRCEIAGCAGTVSSLAMTAPPGESPYDGTSQIVPDGEYLYLLSGTRILRVRKDGTGDFEVITRDQQNIGAIAVRGDTVFWTESILLGRIQSCPTSGCTGSPKVIVSNLHTPKELAVDDEYIYFTDPFDPQLGADTPASSDRVLRCAITGCSKPTALAQKEGIGRPVVTDDEFVYFIGKDRSVPVNSGHYNPGSYVAVFRK